MTPDKAQTIFSLSGDPRWKDFEAEIKELMEAMDQQIHNPKTIHDMTQYYRGGYALGQQILDMRQNAYQVIKAGHGEEQD